MIQNNAESVRKIAFFVNNTQKQNESRAHAKDSHERSAHDAFLVSWIERFSPDPLYQRVQKFVNEELLVLVYQVGDVVGGTIEELHHDLRCGMPLHRPGQHLPFATPVLEHERPAEHATILSLDYDIVFIDIHHLVSPIVFANQFGLPTPSIGQQIEAILCDIL